MEINEVLSKLAGVRQRSSTEWFATCPCHNDQNASLHITLHKGKPLLYCFAGCSFEQVKEALGLNCKPRANRPMAIYNYTNAEGRLLYQVVRFYPKSFVQRRPDGNGGYIYNLDGVERQLYQLPKVLEAVKEGQLVFIVEGEKDCHSLEKIGMTATCVSGGSNAKWLERYSADLFGCVVIVIPDNDEPGMKFAKMVADSLYGWTTSLKMLELPVGNDVSDYLESYTVDDLLLLVVEAEEYLPEAQLRLRIRELEDLLRASGARKSCEEKYIAEDIESKEEISLDEYKLFS